MQLCRSCLESRMPGGGKLQSGTRPIILSALVILNPTTVPPQEISTTLVVGYLPYWGGLGGQKAGFEVAGSASIWKRKTARACAQINDANDGLFRRCHLLAFALVHPSLLWQ